MHHGGFGDRLDVGFDGGDARTYEVVVTEIMIFMVMRVPVTFSMLGACVLSALYLGPKYVSSVFLRLGDGVQSFSFLAIPFFIFAGDIMAEGGISDRLVEVANVMVGRFRTTTESAAIACVYALVITLFVYKTIKVKDIWRIAKRSLCTLAMILSIIAAANAFCYLMSLMQVPAKITQALLTVSDNKYVVLILINILLLVTYVPAFAMTLPNLLMH